MIPETPTVRQPAVAGAFYPNDPQKIQSALDKLLGGQTPTPAIGAMAPHAGWVYSGKTAGLTLGRVTIPETVILMCPHHTGWANSPLPASVYPNGEFLLPGGSVPIDEELVEAIAQRTDLMATDKRAHQREHAIEVLLPFLQWANPNVRIVPIVMKSASFAQFSELATAMAEGIKAVRPGALILASSDMTHFEPAHEAKELDLLALNRIEAMDPEGLMQVVHAHQISMCGVYPTTVMLLAAKALGATQARLIDYSHSGEVSGDFDSVVAYAGVIAD